MISITNYVRVKSLQEAYELNQKRTSRVLGGMMWMRLGNGRVVNAIDLSGLELDYIEETENEFRIGCMCSLRSLELHEGLNTYFQGAVKESVRHIVGVQFRNQATVGGSIFGRFGFSDVLTCFLALDTYVELYEAGIVPLSEFINMKRDNDILVSVIIRKDGRTVRYLSERITKTDFPQIACCAANVNDTWYISVGARPMMAALVTEKCEMKEDKISDFAESVTDKMKFGSNMRASAQYRKRLAQVCIKRAVAAIMESR